MGRPTMSVCIPTYRRPELAVRAIRSVVESARWRAGDVEIIVSDNSPDVSEMACRAALDDWPGRSVYLANRPNLGMIGNFNQCVERASGRWILFVHDDDRLFPAAIPDILYTLEGDDVPPVLLFGVHIVDESGRLVRRREFQADRRLPPRAALRGLLSDVVFAPFPGMVVNAAAYEEVGRFDEAAGPAVDLDMWARLFARFGCRCVPLTTSTYLVQTASVTQTMDYDRRAIDRLLAIFDLAGRTSILSPSELGRCRREFLHQVILGATYSALRAGDVGRARRSIELFDLPQLRGLGWSRQWLPFRLLFNAVLLWPAPFVRALVGITERLRLVRLLRGTG